MATCLVVLAGFLAWARTALPGLPAVWWGLCVFFACRAGQSLPRALMKLGLVGGDNQATDGGKVAQEVPEAA